MGLVSCVERILEHQPIELEGQERRSREAANLEATYADRIGQPFPLPGEFDARRAARGYRCRPGADRHGGSVGPAGPGPPRSGTSPQVMLSTFVRLDTSRPILQTTGE